MEKASEPGGGRVVPERAIVVGRDDELRRLGDLADAAVEQGSHVVFVAGEAGIGKSTLVRHFLGRLASHQWGVHTGQCIEYADRAIPFGPVVTVIRSVLEQAGDDALDVLDHHRTDLAALLPEWRSEGVDGDSLTGDVDRLIDAISSVLVRAAARRPLALFVEDIHWADSATRDVVASLVHSLGSARVLVIVSERTGALPRGHHMRTWLAEQRRFPNVDTIALEGLSIEALAEQARHILGEAADDALITELARRTAGNAYFANELLLARRSGGEDLPDSLADFLTSRIEHLEAEEQEVLRAMAIAGDAIGHRLLAQAMPNVDIGPPVRQLFDNAFITMENGDYLFAHALMREAILKNVLPFEAEEIHRRLAEGIVADPRRGTTLADLTSLAVHWAGANDDARALAAAIPASQASADVAAYEPAARLATDALRRWVAVPDAEERTGTTKDALTVKTSDWLVASNHLDEAGDLLAEALRTWGRDLPHGRHALLKAKLAPIRFLSGEPDEATALLEEAVDLVGDEASPEAAQVHHRVAKLALVNAKIHEAMAAADRAIEIASEAGPEHILIEALSTKALGIGVTDNMESGIELVKESRRRALAENLVSQVAHTYRTEMMILYFRMGRTQRSLDVLREGIEFANRRCGPSLRMDLVHDLALGLVEDGNLEEAGPLLEELMATVGESLRDLAILQTHALYQLLAGRLDEAEEVLTEARTSASRFGAQEEGFQHRLEAELARRRGDFDTALRLIDAALELQLESDNVTFTRESIIEKCRLVRAISAVDAARGASLRPATEELIDKLGPGDPASESLTELMRLELALADNTAKASDARELANRLAERGFGADAKQTKLIHVQLLASESPDAEELPEALAELREISAASGMRWLGDAADELAASTTIDLTSPTLDLTDTDVPEPETDDHGLTPREIEVLGALARGLTNKEIGSELYVSHRTISTHVSNLLSKLHLKSRSEAAAKFHELGFAKLNT